MPQYMGNTTYFAESADPDAILFAKALHRLQLIGFGMQVVNIADVLDKAFFV